MLNHNQIKFLSKMSGIELIYIEDMPVSVKRIVDKEIKYPYELFKKHMGIGDIRLHWLLGHNNMIAGGSVLNWIWGEEKYEDIDFFFRGSEYAETFKLFIQNIGFESTRLTNYAETFFNKDGGVILQVVGGKEVSRDFRAYGPANMILENFDMHVCKFAVDCDYIYTSTRAIQDLLKLTVDPTGNERQGYCLLRFMKYIKKGFFPSPKMLKAFRYEKPHYVEKRRTIYDESGW